jgi:DNA-binding XRE family transcriptional regulator
MTPDELKKARAALGDIRGRKLTGAELAKALGITDRTYRGYEAGFRRETEPVEIPAKIATMVRLALRNATVRRELGIKS